MGHAILQRKLCKLLSMEPSTIFRQVALSVPDSEGSGGNVGEMNIEGTASCTRGNMDLAHVFKWMCHTIAQLNLQDVQLCIMRLAGQGWLFG